MPGRIDGESGSKNILCLPGCGNIEPIDLYVIAGNGIAGVLPVRGALWELLSFFLVVTEIQMVHL
jgi:hypothetical protein